MNRITYRLFMVFLLTSLFLQVKASDDTDIIPSVDSEHFPDYVLIAETEIPAVDRYDIAERFHGIVAPESVSISSDIERQINDVDFFRISAIEGGGTTIIPARLVAIGDHSYVWVEDGFAYDAETVTNFTERFDNEVYTFVRNLWGSEPLPGIDDESRLHIVFTPRLRTGVGGYYSAGNSYSATIVPHSNERDMLILNTFYLFPQSIDSGLSSTAHEFHHMIQHFRDSDETNWVNEGLATLTEQLYGMDNSDFMMNAFAQSPETPLTMWGLGDNRPAEYGAAVLFIMYLYDRFGIEFIQDIANNPKNSLDGIHHVLQMQTGYSVNVIFADWALANLLRDSTTAYGYRSLPEIDSMAIEATINTLPFRYTSELNQYATHYYRVFEPAETIHIDLQMADTIPVIPVDIPDGSKVWYSQRGDNANPRLTRSFNLSDVSTAQLEFNIWHDLETDWDYGYISVSVDGGISWELQSTQLMSDTNLYRRAYGTGYTGNTNTWLRDSLSLDAYAGQEILVRFEMITDDAINHSGIAIDNMQLEATGYQSNFDADDGGWESNGWIRMDNRLPQRAWVQVLEYTQNTTRLHRFIAQGSGQWDISISEGTRSLDIAVSTFAPMTSEEISYTLQVE